MKLLSIAMLAFGLVCANAYAEENVQVTTTKVTTTTGDQASMQSSKTPLTGEEFLAQNKKKTGVVTLPDGLQYKVITEGKGPKPSETDTVTVHYAGTLINGKKFDSSYDRGEPATFPVNGVIAGWVEALQLMNEGSTWELYIPANLAYGEQGAPPSIGPNEVLIFKVELLKVNKS